MAAQTRKTEPEARVATKLAVRTLEVASPEADGIVGDINDAFIIRRDPEYRDSQRVSREKVRAESKAYFLKKYKR